MKILFVSIPALHTVRWIENLKEAGHDIYWFNVLGNEELLQKSYIKQITNWKYRKIPHFKGEHYLRKQYPNLYEKIQSNLEVTANEKLEQLIKEVKPDLVHSFEMHTGSYAILKTMLKFPHLKWLYSCWGSDFYKYENSETHIKKIKKVLNRIDYLHTDCLRDYNLAIKYGFKGEFSGVIPGGGGFMLKENQKHLLPIENRRIILVKGYQHHVGRGLQIIKAFEKVLTLIHNYDVIVFGAHLEVTDYIEKNKLSFKYFGRHDLEHNEILELMGKSLIYVGNSTSDGIPNTLLEAIIMGAFPIQSNPGNVTAEIITEGENGFLIEDPNDIDAISKLILKAIDSSKLLQNAFEINQNIAKERLDYAVNHQKIVALYQQIAKDL